MTQTRRIEILNSGKFHGPGCRQVAQVASAFSSTSWLTCEGEVADAEDFLDLMALQLRHGQFVEITAEGQDEAECVAALVDLISNGFFKDDYLGNVRAYIQSAVPRHIDSLINIAITSDDLLYWKARQEPHRTAAEIAAEAAGAISGPIRITWRGEDAGGSQAAVETLDSTIVWEGETEVLTFSQQALAHYAQCIVDRLEVIE